MQRYFIQPNQMTDHDVTITGDDVHHIVKVMRSQIGAEFFVCDGQGRVALARLSQIEAGQVQAQIIEWRDEQTELPIRVTIGQGLPKGDKMEWMIQKGTELGAYAFFPFVSERTVVKLDEKKESKKLERWGKIIKEAAEQSHRAVLPRLLSPVSFRQAINASGNYTACVIAYEKETGKRFGEVVRELAPSDSLLVLIGPEGGFSQEEVQLAEEAGVIPVTLGPRIMRTETASQYVLAGVSYQFEQA